MVFGDRRPYLVALVVPRAEFMESFTRDQKGKGNGSFDAALDRAIAAAVERANASLPANERVRHFMIAREPFTIENGLMTPTLKIRRHAIRQIYGDALAGLYEARSGT